MNQAASDAMPEVPVCKPVSKTSADQQNVTPTTHCLGTLAGVQLMDLSTVNKNARGFSGIASDGRFIYYAPLNNGAFFGEVYRYDSQLGFTDPEAWIGFDCAQLNTACKGFTDIFYDGRYVTLVPFCNGEHHGHVTQYDTQKPFTDISSWAYFDVTTLNAKCRGFVSGCFDGRYLFLSPYQLDFATHHGCIVRFDTRMPLTDRNAWQDFDASQLAADCRGFHSAITTERHIYFVPYCLENKKYNGLLLRYQRRKSFIDPSAWQTFELSTVDPMCKGFIGGDYQHGKLYLAPYFDGKERHGRVMQFDDGADLDDSSAWRVFDSTRIHEHSRGFFGAVCDAQYLYLLPHCRGVNEYHGQITRYCLDGEFTASESWSVCDLAVADARCKGFIGGVIFQGDLLLAPFETAEGGHSGLTARVQLNQSSLWSAS